MRGKPQYLKLRCYAYPKQVNGKNGYMAICVDLSLSTWRPSFKEAKQSLSDAIIGYLDTKHDLIGEKKFNSLNELKKYILRRTPFFPHIFRFELLNFLSQFKNSDNQHDWYCEQPLATPA